MAEKNSLVATFLVSAVLAFSAPAFGQSLTTNPLPPGPVSQIILPSIPGQTSITQSTSLTPVPGSVACNAGGYHTNNSYWRSFVLSSFPALDQATFRLDSVEFGVELADANGTGTTQPIVVRIYSHTGAPFPGGTNTLVSTNNLSVADQTLSLLSFHLAPAVTFNNATDTVVVEVFSPDGRPPTNNRFFIGSNAAGQSAPSYLSAADCGAPAPTDLASLGFPNMHVIMRLNGQNSVAVPTLSLAALIGLGLLLAGTGVVMIRRVA
jgi:hypothetical protein